ncbi:unnamed protein product [Prunus brigantina]
MFFFFFFLISHFQINYNKIDFQSIKKNTNISRHLQTPQPPSFISQRTKNCKINIYIYIYIKRKKL